MMDMQDLEDIAKDEDTPNKQTPSESLVESTAALTTEVSIDKVGISAQQAENDIGDSKVS